MPPEPATDDAFVETTLGFADNPDAIQCRKCGRVLFKSTLFFRRKRTGELRWHTVCRQCSDADPYRATAKGRARLMDADASVPANFVPRAAEAFNVARKRKMVPKQTTQEQRAFIDRWALVRRVMTARRARLVQALQQSKHNYKKHGFSTLYSLYMGSDGLVENHVEALKSMYAQIVGDMYPVAAWIERWQADGLKNRMPPTRWDAMLDEMARRGTLPVAMEIKFNPWWLASKDSRDRVRASVQALNAVANASSTQHRTPLWFTDWSVLTEARDASTMHFQMFPWRCPPQPYQTGMPDWLIEHTSSKQPKGFMP